MNLADILKRSAEAFPDRTAIVFYDRRIRYEELYESVSHFAYALGDIGVGPGTRVALVSPNTPEFAIGLYGALAAGAEVVAVNPQYTAREMGYIFKDSGVSHAIVNPMFEEPVRAGAGDRPLRIIYSDSMGDPAKTDIKKLITEARSSAAPADRKPHNTALIVYTNAYRGYYLGACLTHEGLIFDAEASKKVSLTTEESAFVAVIPLFHAFSATVNLNLPLLSGGKSVLHEVFREERVAADIDKERVTVFAAVPAVFRRLLDKFGGAGMDFSHVGAFVPGGAPLPMDLYMDFCLAFRAQVYEGYGITECGPVTSVNPIYKRLTKPGSVGPPLEGVSVRIESENGTVLPAGTQGELVVRGKNVMSGYLNRPDETDRFLKDGWFHTGDVARLDEEGFIFLTGRLKRLIIVGGFNVYAEEVEQYLSAHPAVRNCRIFSGPDEIMGEKVLAEVVLKPDAKTDAQELRKYLRSGLAPYKTPRRVEIVQSP